MPILIGLMKFCERGCGSGMLKADGRDLQNHGD